MRVSKSKQALSPIFATLILIAIAVIASIIIYLFTTGTVASLTAGATYGKDKVAFDAVSGSYTTVNVYAHSLDGTVKVNSAMVQDASGNVVATVYSNSGYGQIVVSEAITPVMLNIADGYPTSIQLWSDSKYTVTFVTESGGSFTSPTFTAT